MSLAATDTALGERRPRRRPGFGFEAVAPAPADALPRMDVALFAGIAECGPVGVPVPVEDLAQYRAWFGGDAPLAWDDARGRPALAQLHRAVALFFANGGRRCLVLRLARGAEASRVPLHGVWTAAGALLQPAQLPARSPGRWADGVEAATSLEADRAAALALEGDTLWVTPPASGDWAVGDLLRLRWPARVVYAGIAERRVEADDSGVGTVNRWRLRLRPERFAVAPDEDGSAPALLPTAPWPAGLPRVERLRLTLWARGAGLPGPRRVAALGLAPGHARHLLALPDDAALSARDDAHAGAVPGRAAALRTRWPELLQPRWPLGNEVVEGAEAAALPFCLPMGVGALPQAWRAATHSGADALVRDGLVPFDAGLVPFDAGLFADPALIASPASTLLADAEQLRVQSRTPRALQGLHAALAVEEVSLIAVPDAGHAGWELGAPPPLPPVPTLPGPAPVEPAVPPTFAACDPAPTPVAPPSAPAPAPPLVWRLRPARPSIEGRATLLAVQRLLLRLVLARRDLLALLSLPPGADDAEGLAQRARLLAPALPETDGVPALGGGEHAALGLAALQHGALVVRRGDALETTVNDGAVAGLIAAQSRVRGAWIAAANRPLSGTLAVAGAAAEPALDTLLAARVNLLAARPAGLVLLNADTLGPGVVDDLRPLSARRLLQLLRRLAQQEAPAWVFEPLGAALERGLQRSLEARLRGLFERGAFAGRRAEDSFQVAIDGRDAGEGRLVVELRVAPSHPMAFVTLRLVRSGDGLHID